jgi:hypothetical protein
MGILCLTGDALAASQYRQDQAPVLIPADNGPTDNTAGIVESFRQKYVAAKQPRIALFWNRELTDNLARRTYQRSSTSSTKSESSTATGDKDNKSDAKTEQANATTINSLETVEDNQHESLDPRRDALLKTAFVAAMRAGGVHFIDRSLLVRAAATRAAPAVDAQLNEMTALQNNADWLMEVVLIRDANAPLGFSFKVSVEDIHNETEIMDLFTQATPSAHGRSGYVAVNGGAGFIPASPPPVTVPEVGSTLGVQIMGQLAAQL